MLRFLVPACSLAVASLLLPPNVSASAECSPAGDVAGVRVASIDTTLVSLFESGQPYTDFLAAAVRRRDQWLRTTEKVQIADSSLARARAVGGNWRLLVVAIDACGDSMQQVPYVAALADKVDGLSMRIVPPAAGRPVQEAHRSLDGRTATPTFVLIDESGADKGCIVELPRSIRHWTHERLDAMSSNALHAHRLEWYEADAGASIVHEVVELMENAAAGTPLCERGASR